MLALFTLGTFSSAFLLFIVQPLFAKLILPLLGGAPAVWTACMLFFQVALLAGYWYAHSSIRILGVPRQAALHAVVVLVPLALLPFHVDAAAGAGREGAPVIWLMGVMLTSIGLPFFVLAATAPLLQRWLASTVHPSAADPYFLYAASNAGSLAALLLYPSVVEPLLSLRAQRLAWAWGYAASACLVAGCAAAAWRLRSPDIVGAAAPADAAVPWGLRLRWLALAFVPSGLMLAVTAHISTDLAAIPLLWIVPLALYLATFIVAFGRWREAAQRAARRLLPLVLLPLVLFLIAQGAAPLWFILPLHLVTFATVALVCHAEIAALRPSASDLTGFYLWMAGGGALGGLLNTAAPWVFTGIAEYPLLLAGACFVLIRRGDVQLAAGRLQTAVKPVAVGLMTAGVLLAARTLDLTAPEMLPFLGFPALIAFTASRQMPVFALCVAALLVAAAVAPLETWGAVLHQQRTFFGVYRVTHDADREVLSLYHGTTLHGSQAASSGAAEPLTYYHRGSPVADVLALRRASDSAVGVVGLGVGSLAAYARPGERWIFYEIDPVVDEIARDTRFFTFLEACGTACRTVIGDGRLEVAASADRHEVIVLDAFSSDAIPVHLLTREAVDVYLSRLAADGVLAFHISNRHFDLQPVLGGIVADLQLVAFVRDDVVATEGAEGRSSSRWIAVGRPGSRAEALADQAGWRPVTGRTARVWTDDFSNIWSVLRR